MSRLRSLQDFLAANLDTIAECKGCGRRVRVDTREVLQAQTVKWRKSLELQGARLRCTVCKHRGARLAPAPKIVGPLDCDEFRADIDRMWEKVMTERPEQDAQFVIEGPDEDGCVWICSSEGREAWCANLGPKDKAAELFSDWLGQVDYQENA